MQKEYEERMIDQGGFGAVYELIGYLPPAVIKYLKNVEDKVSFEREFKMLKELSHSNIVNLIEIKVENPRKFGIIMEYCKRGSLDKLFKSPQIIYTMNTVLQWAIQLFDVLIYIGQHNIVHRDIKPANIFLTDSFVLKLGDFGLVKMSEATCSGTFAGTERYTSPPEGSTYQNMKISLRNDVYSMGLVLWELIERRSVFAKYMISGHRFDNHRFWEDINSGELTHLEPPNCQDLSGVVAECTNFDYSLRPKADEVLIKVNTIRNTNDFIEKLDFLPIVEETSTTLFRPIGFDATEERVPVWTDSSSSLDFGQTEQDSISDKFNEFLHSLEERENPSDTRIRKKLLEKFNCLTTQEKKSILERIPKIVYRTQNEVHFFDERHFFHYKLPKEDDDLPEDLEVLFRYLCLYDLNDQIENLEEIFFILTIITRNSFSTWRNYQIISKHLETLERRKVSRYTFRIYFKCYFSTVTHREWLFLDPSQDEFITKDFTEIQSFAGNWQNKDEKVFVREERHEKIMQKHRDRDELHFSHNEPVDFYKVIELLRNVRKRLEKVSEFVISKYVPLKDLDHIDEGIKEHMGNDFKSPHPFFQLRNPPRRSCEHEERCPIKMFSPLQETWKENSEHFYSYPPEMQVPYYECSSQEDLVILESFFRYLLKIEPYLEDEHEDWSANDFLGVDLQGIAQKTEDSFMFLNCPYFLKETTLNKSSNSDQIEGMSPKFIILLDHPRNYDKDEKIPCLTYEFGSGILYLDVDNIDKHLKTVELKERIYTVLNHQLEAKIIDYRGNPLSNCFNLFNWKRSDFPRMLLLSSS